MTGYGRTEVQSGENRFAIEVRSLNNRYLDIQIKAPRSLAMLEPRIRKTVQDRFSRGRFDVYVAASTDREKTGRIAIDEKMAANYIAALKHIKKKFKLKGDVDLTMIAGFRDLLTLAAEDENAEGFWKILSPGLSQVLDELDAMRTAEGAVLVQDIRTRLDAVSRMSKTVQELAPATVDNARKRMSETLTRLLNEQPDPVRLAQEIAILAERTDITEELTRLDSHVQQFCSLLGGASSESIGKKLDFLLQEMNREVNTIASKAMNARISLEVVSMKAELEKIREQVQNIE